jgi:predicted porin
MHCAINLAAIAPGSYIAPAPNQNMETIVKKLLAFAGLSLAAAAAVHAQSSVTLYGLVDTGIDIARAGKGTEWRQISGGAFGSRLGFRSVEDLGGGLSAVFRLESGINIDVGSYAQGGIGFGRESSVGLASSTFGTVNLGRLPTPYYAVQSAVDAFSWYGSGGLTSITRSAASTVQVVPLAVNARSENAVGYVSPRWGGVEVRLLGGFGEHSAELGNSYGASARYNNGPVELVGGFHRQSAAGTGAARAGVVGGSYDFGVARVFAGWTEERNNCSTCTGGLAPTTRLAAGGASEFRLINIGAKIPTGAWTTFVQYVRVQDRGNSDRDANWFAIGGEYALSKRTAIYTTLGTINNRNGSQYALGSGTAQQPAGFVAAGDPRSTTFTLGIRHGF